MRRNENDENKERLRKKLQQGKNLQRIKKYTKLMEELQIANKNRNKSLTNFYLRLKQIFRFDLTIFILFRSKT